MGSIGYSTLSVIPSAKGFGTALTKEATPQMAAAGAKLGKVFVAGAVVAAAAITAFAVKGVKSFATLETGMNEVFTLLPGVTETAMQSMTDDTRAFALEMGTTTDKVVPALYQAISAGVPAGSVFDFLEVAQKAALGGVTELTTAVDGISSVVNAYGEDVVSAADASDLMFTAVRLGKTNFEELSSSLFNVTPTAAALGVGFGDVTAGLAAMTAQGVPTRVASTQMRQMFIELSKAGSGTAKVFEDASGKTFKDFIASGGNVNDALNVMGEYATDNGLNINDLFGSVEAGSAALALFDNSAFTGALDEMGNSAGATDAAFEQMDQGLGRTWDRIKSVFSDAAIEIGERLAPKVQELATWFGEWLPGAIDATFAAFSVISDYITGTVIPVISSVVDWIKQNKDWLSALAVSVGTVVLIWTAYTTAMTIWSAVTKTAAAIQLAFNTVMALNPIALVVIAVAALVAGLVWFFTKTKTGQKVWETFTKAISAGWDWIKKAFAAGRDAVTAVLGKIKDKFSSVKTSIGGYITAIVDWFKGLPDRIVSGLGNIALKITSKFSSIKGTIRGYVNSVVGWFKGIPGRLSWALSGVGAKITSPFKSAFNAVARFWNNSVGKINFDVPSWVPGVGGKSFGIPNIPYLADGGVVSSPTLAMIGEGREPEAVIPLSKLDEMLSGKGNGPGITQENHFYGLMDAATAAQEMLRRLQIQGV